VQELEAGGESGAGKPDQQRRPRVPSSQSANPSRPSLRGSHDATNSDQDRDRDRERGLPELTLPPSAAAELSTPQNAKHTQGQVDARTSIDDAGAKALPVTDPTAISRLYWKS